MLSEETEIPLRQIQGGYHVKDLPDGRCVDVMIMLWNWRVVRSDQGHMGMDRGWCYEGTGPATFQRAVVQALTWDGADDTEPEGWIKRVASAWT